MISALEKTGYRKLGNDSGNYPLSERMNDTGVVNFDSKIRHRYVNGSRQITIYEKRDKLNALAGEWKSLPEAYEFIMSEDNSDLLVQMSPEEVLDLYSRVAFYDETTRGTHGIVVGDSEKLLAALIEKHPVLNKDAENYETKLRHEAKYLPSAMFRDNAYREKNIILGSRLEREVSGVASSDGARDYVAHEYGDEGSLENIVQIKPAHDWAF